MSTSYRTVSAMMVDTETGEPLEGFPVLQRQRGKHYWEATFVVNFQDALKAVAPDLSGEEARLLIYLLGTVGLNNQWNILNQGEISEGLKMSRPQVSRSLRSLTEKQIIAKGTRIGTQYAYTLNPHLGWKGQFKNHASARKQASNLVLVHSREVSRENFAA